MPPDPPSASRLVLKSAYGPDTCQVNLSTVLGVNVDGSPRVQDSFSFGWKLVIALILVTPLSELGVFVQQEIRMTLATPEKLTLPQQTELLSPAFL